MSSLPEDLVEEVLLRFSPEDPAGLVRAALVCRGWSRIVADPGFRGRFREFHRSPPMLGLLCNHADIGVARFVPTTAFCSPRADREPWRVLDARHGRVLLRGEGGVLVVWDPIRDEERELPLPPRKLLYHNAAVLCSAGAGACHHVDCHHGPFLVIFVCSRRGKTLVYTYSSDADAWRNPVCAKQDFYLVDFTNGGAIVGNNLYFGNELIGNTNTVLKYSLELCQMSWILVPFLASTWRYALTTLEDGGLGIAAEDDSKLCMWSRKDTREIDSIWERRVVIELKTMFRADIVLTKCFVIGSADGLGIIFMSVDDVVYTIDLKTYEVKKVYEGTTDTVFPYISFYAPALKAT